MARPRGPALSSEIILDQIEITFKDLGINDLTISMISKLLDIKSPSLYSHFDGLEDIKDKLTERALLSMHAYLADAIERNKRKDKLKSFMFGYRDFARSYPLLFDCSQFGIRADNEHLMNLGNQIVNLSLGLLQERGISGENAIHKVRIVRSVLNGFILLEKQNGFQRNESPDKTFLELFKFTLKGIS